MRGAGRGGGREGRCDVGTDEGLAPLDARWTGGGAPAAGRGGPRSVLGDAWTSEL